MCETVFPGKWMLSDHQIIALSCVNLLIAVANISVNILLIYALLKLRLIKTISYKFILFLCVSDCLVGLLPQACLTGLLLQSYKSASNDGQCALEIMTQSLQAAFCQFSVIMILIITMDRYLHMNYLTKYNTYMTKQRALVLLIMNIIVCVLIIIANVLASVYEVYFVVHTTVLSLNTVIIVFIFAIYTRTFLSIRSRVRDIRTGSENSTMSSGQLIKASKMMNTMRSKFIKRRQQYHLSFAKAMIFVLLALAICYLPYLATVSIVTYTKDKHLKPNTTSVILLYWSFLLVYSNSFFNGIILVFSNKRMRRFLSDMLRSATRIQERPKPITIANANQMITIHAQKHAQNTSEPQKCPVALAGPLGPEPERDKCTA